MSGSTRLLASLFVVTALMCYVAFPNWLGMGRPRLAYVMLVLHSVALFFALWWWCKKPYEEYEALPREWRWPVLVKPPGLVLLAGLIVLGALHLRMASVLPILSDFDEPVMILHTLRVAEALRESGISLYSVGMAACLGTLLAAVVWPLAASRPPWGKRKILLLVYLLTTLGVAVAYFVLARHVFGSAPVFRWPPLGSVLALANQMIVGPSVVAARLPAVLFYLLTAVYLYRIIASTQDRWLAVATSLACLLTPVFFQFGHIETRDPGGALFLTAGGFYLIRHLRFGRSSDAGMTALMAAMGFLYRRPAVILLFIAPAVVLTILWIGKERAALLRGWSAVRCYGGALAFAVVMILPWWFMSKTYVARDFTPHFDNLVDPASLTAYARLFPQAFGWPFTVLVVVGLIATVVRRRNVDAFALISLAFIYGFFTLDDPDWLPSYRFLVIMAPVAALLAAAAVSWLTEPWRKSRSTVAVVLLILSVGPLASWFLGRPLPLIRPASENSLPSQPHYAFDKLVTWLQLHEPDGCIVALRGYWQTPIPSYARFLGAKNIRHMMWIESDGQAFSIERLQQRAAESGADYLIAPNGVGLGLDTLNPVVYRLLEENRIPGFEKVASFDRGNMRLLLCRIRVHPDIP